MGFRLGYAAGFATGYYLGSRAGRERHDQINRAIRRVRRSPGFGSATERAREAVGDAAAKARGLMERRAREHAEAPEANPLERSGDGSADGPNTVPATAPLIGKGPTPPPPPYSSSR